MADPSNADVQKVWQQATDQFFCGRCKAARLVIWHNDVDQPQHTTEVDDCYVAVFCHFFHRRIEAPAALKRCGAFEAREEKRKGKGRHDNVKSE